MCSSNYGERSFSFVIVFNPAVSCCFPFNSLLFHVVSVAEPCRTSTMAADLLSLAGAGAEPSVQHIKDNALLMIVRSLTSINEQHRNSAAALLIEIQAAAQHTVVYNQSAVNILEYLLHQLRHPAPCLAARCLLGQTRLSRAKPYRTSSFTQTEILFVVM